MRTTNVDNANKGGRLKELLFAFDGKHYDQRLALEESIVLGNEFAAKCSMKFDALTR